MASGSGASAARLLVPPFDDELIMAGQGTAAAELLEEVPDLEILVVPVSGGGLMAGSAIAARHASPSIVLYGVEPEAGSDTAQSLARGERVSIEIPKTIADGLQVAQPGALTFPILQQTLAGVLLVSDEELIETLTWMLERMKILVEPSGVAAAAAVRHRKADFTGQPRRSHALGGQRRPDPAGRLPSHIDVGRPMRRRALFVLAALAAAGQAAAHDLWIEPSTFHPRSGETVDARRCAWG